MYKIINLKISLLRDSGTQKLGQMVTFFLGKRGQIMGRRRMKGKKKGRRGEMDDRGGGGEVA